jgi:hypothetical protein
MSLFFFFFYSYTKSEKWGREGTGTYPAWKGVGANGKGEEVRKW